MQRQKLKRDRQAGEKPGEKQAVTKQKRDRQAGEKKKVTEEKRQAGWTETANH